MRVPLPSIVLAVLIIAVSSCGSTQAPASHVSAADIVVQLSDLSSSFQKCLGPSGSIESLIEAMKAQNPTESSEFKSAWDKIKSQGAKALWITVYSDSAANCAGTSSESGSPSLPSYPLVQSLIIQFNDQATAARLYKSGPVAFMPDPSALMTQGVVRTATGLGQNSFAITEGASYTAYWQNKEFIVSLSAWNVDPSTCDQIAVKMNSRIR
jgi:hypothetical protein